MVIFYVESRDCSEFPYKEFKTFAAASRYAKTLSEKYSDCEFFVSVMIPDARFTNGVQLC